MSIAQARCLCGAVGMDVPRRALFVIACHCTACRRRSGGPFGVGAYFAAEQVREVGEAAMFARSTDSGGWMRNRFCTTCGTTIWWTIDSRPDLVGVAAGTIDGLVPDAPLHSLFERSRQDWLQPQNAEVRHPAGYPT